MLDITLVAEGENFEFTVTFMDVDEVEPFIVPQNVFEESLEVY